MTEREFEELVLQALWNDVETRLLEKGKLYAGKGEADRFAQFKRIASRTGLTPSQVCVVLMEKHYELLVERVMNGDTEGFRHLIVETIPDLVAYLFLLYGMVWEEKKAEEMKQCSEEKSHL